LTKSLAVKIGIEMTCELREIADMPATGHLLGQIRPRLANTAQRLHIDVLTQRPYNIGHVA
jgi:hypothetical protein